VREGRSERSQDSIANPDCRHVSETDAMKRDNKTKKQKRFILRNARGTIPLRPPGYFADCYSKEEIREDNLIAKASIVRPPRDLE
jgi:hypothetical protein